MNVPGCSWVRATGQRVVHVQKGNATLCRRRLRNPILIRELKPDVLIQYSGDDCLRCLGVFNALLCEPEPAAPNKAADVEAGSG